MKALKYGITAVPMRFLGLICIVLAPLFSSSHDKSTEPRNDDKFTVVLDAGHGGHDPGNLGNGYYEKNIALNIVLKAGALLEKNPDIKVIYTRKDDTFVDLYVRGEIANKAGADLFVSVHCDSHNSQAHGAGTFVLGLHANKQNFEIAKKENSVIYLEDDYKDRYADYDINSPESVIGLTIMQEEFLDQSIALAKDIQENFIKAERKDRKVKQAGFIVLHQTVMPSVLVETGFLTNDEEGAYLDSKKGQSQMGEAIGKAILSYKENAMANMADFDPVAMVEAPDPEDAGRQDDRKMDTGKKDASGAADEALASKDSEVVDTSKVDREARKKARQEKRRAKETERDAETASSKETAQIIEEARSRSEREANAQDGSSVSESNGVVAPGDVAPGSSSASNNSEAESDIAEANSESGDGPVEVVVSARPKRVEPKENPKKATEKPVQAKEKDKKTSSEAPRITYRVQIMASGKDLPLRPASFNGLNRVAKEPYNNLYRYVYGSTSSLREAKMLKSNADIKGYPSSFIVVYRDGERITFKESKEFLSKQ